MDCVIYAYKKYETSRKKEEKRKKNPIIWKI